MIRTQKTLNTPAQAQHSREAPDLGGVSDRETRPLPGGDHGEPLLHELTNQFSFADQSDYAIQVKAKSQFKRRSTANNVEIYIPVPSDADSPKFKTTLGV